jgi:hypothetical protein
MEEDKVVLPTIQSRIEQTLHLPIYPVAHLFCLGEVAKRAGPGEIVEVVGSPPTRVERALRQLVVDVVVPARTGNDVFDVKWAGCRHEAVFTGIPGAKAHGKTYLLTPGHVSLL